MRVNMWRLGRLRKTKKKCFRPALGFANCIHMLLSLSDKIGEIYIAPAGCGRGNAPRLVRPASEVWWQQHTGVSPALLSDPVGVLVSFPIVAGGELMNNLEAIQSIYAGRRVLVTGSTGFKGSWLCLWLKHMGAEVLGIGLEPPSIPSMHNALRLHEVVRHEHVDVGALPQLEACVRNFQPEIVLHLAGQAIVRLSYDDPISTLHTNIMGTAHLLEACRNCPSVRAVVIVTSDKCYRNNEWVWGYRENDPMGGYDPYSASKGCAELVTASYIKSFFGQESYGKTHHVAVASARAGNAIGGGDWGRDRLIPDCFRALHEGRPIHIRYPSAVRPWQHALECLSGYLQLGARLYTDGPKYGCGWNFAPIDMGDVWPVERVVRRICSLWGNGAYEVDEGVQPHEAHMLCLDCTKANIELGWRPRYKVAEALDVTVAWYREWSSNPDPSHMREVTLRQIDAYVGDGAAENEVA